MYGVTQSVKKLQNKYDYQYKLTDQGTKKRPPPFPQQYNTGYIPIPFFAQAPKISQSWRHSNPVDIRQEA